MPAIRAFVGHSFAEDDEELIRRFEKHFDNLEIAQPEFSWDHALRAKPISVSEKVLGLAADKNVFVAICTRKEQVLTKPYPESWYDRLRLKESDFLWKTSDWIIQETGLAKGMNMTSVIFLEKGVRPPSGLLSDLEWIEFERDKPEVSFGPFMQMIGSLVQNLNRIGADIVTQATSPPPPEVSSEAPATEQTLSMEPQLSWSREDFEFAAFRAVGISAGLEVEQMLTKGFAESSFGREPGAMNEWNALFEQQRIIFGTGGSIATLRKYRDGSPESYRIRLYLARTLEEFDQWKDAADEYASAAAKAPNAEKSATIWLSAASAYRKSGNHRKAEEAEARGRELVATDAQAEISFLKKQKSIADPDKDQEILVGSLERILQVDPTDADARFSLAYNYNQMGEHELSLYHYHLIPYAEREGGTWNNLGNDQYELGLPALGVYSYKKAIEQGETLAASNLANKYIELGFLEDAKALCDATNNKPDRHKNLLSTLTRIHEIPDEERKKQEEIRDKARRDSEFYMAFGRASARLLPADLPEVFRGPDCALRISIADRAFSAVGEYKEPINLLAALMIGPSQASTHHSIPYKVSYKGTLWGSAVVATIRKQRTDRPPPGLIDSEPDIPVLMYFDDEAKMFLVLEKARSSPKRYSLQAS